MDRKEHYSNRSDLRFGVRRNAPKRFLEAFGGDSSLYSNLIIAITTL